MANKTARVYALDELKEKCQKASKDPKLVEIVKTAPLNKGGEVNLSWIYKEAEKHVHEQTKDLQKTKELATSARFLGMLRRDYEEKFKILKTLVAQELSQEIQINRVNNPEAKVEQAKQKKQFSDIEFELPTYAIVITRTPQPGSIYKPTSSVQFNYGGQAKDFCIAILKSILDTDESWLDTAVKEDIRKGLIQLLEENFCLKVKVCGNCTHCGEITLYGVPDGWHCRCPHIIVHPHIHLFCTCKHWAPKEVLGEKES